MCSKRFDEALDRRNDQILFAIEVEYQDFTSFENDNCKFAAFQCGHVYHDRCVHWFNLKNFKDYSDIGIFKCPLCNQKKHQLVFRSHQQSIHNISPLKMN
mmetsp:Transcript_35171/g.34202  ORF Transcript_35171/g.34202 Transcript_35171/m.34202 type:complete len:100 (+) Transcript_35171:2282-2581(+)